jgi:hypothetical protein
MASQEPGWWAGMEPAQRTTALIVAMIVASALFTIALSLYIIKPW